MRRQLCIVTAASLAVTPYEILTGSPSATRQEGPPFVNGNFVGRGDGGGEVCPTFGNAQSEVSGRCALALGESVHTRC
jgi:hypothetical protein